MRLSKKNRYKIKIGRKQLEPILTHDDAVYWAKRLEGLKTKSVICFAEKEY